MPENKISTKKLKVIPFVIIILFIILGLIGVAPLKIPGMFVRFNKCSGQNAAL